MNRLDRLQQAIRDVPDFPKPGIIFKDITPILADGALLRDAVALFTEKCAGLQVRKIAGIEARGFVFGSAVAAALGVGFVPVRKKGKLPARRLTRAYSLEYGIAEIEIHTDAFEKGERVVLIDDLLATGGTAHAAAELLLAGGANLVEIQFLIELSPLNGRAVLKSYPVESFLVF